MATTPNQQANLLFKQSQRVPSTNANISSTVLEKLLPCNKVVYQNDIYSSNIPSNLPTLLYTFVPATATTLTMYNYGTLVNPVTINLTAAQLNNLYGATASLWTALFSNSIASISVPALSAAVCFVQQVQTVLLNGTLMISPSFYSNNLLDVITAYPITVTDGVNALTTPAVGNWIAQPESGVIQFFDSAAVASYGGTVINLFPIANATTQTWFSTTNPIQVTCWLYSGRKGAIQSLTYDSSTSTTTVTGNQIVTGNMTVNLATSLQTLTATTTNLGTTTVSGLTATGVSSLQNVSAAAATVTSLVSSGATNTNSLVVTNTSTVGGLTAGATTLGSVSVTGTTVLTGNITSAVNITAALTSLSVTTPTLTATAFTTGSATVSNNLVVNGVINANGGQSSTAFSGAISAPSSTVTGASSTGSLSTGAFSATGASTLSGGVSGTTNFNGNVGIASGFGLTSAGTGTTNLGGQLLVAGATQLNGGISAPLAINSSLSTTGTAAFADVVTLSKSLQLNSFVTINAAGTVSSAAKGYLFSTPSSTAYAIYMSTPGAGNSIAASTIASFKDVTGYAIRTRVATNATNGFVWENDTDQALMSLNASTGNLNLFGAANVPTLNVTGLSTLSAIAVTSSTNTGNSTVNGLTSTTSSLGSASAASLTISGATVLSTLTASGLSTLTSATISGNLTSATTANLATVNVSSTATLSGPVQINNTLTTGTALTTVGGNLTVQGTSTSLVNTSVTGTLGVAGVASFNNNVSVTGTNTFSVGTGLSTFNGNITALGTNSFFTTNVSGELGVSGISNFSNSVRVLGANTLTMGTGLFSTSGNASIGGTSLLAGAVTMNSDLSVIGNLSITGTVTSVNSNSVNVTDKIIHLANDQSDPALVNGGGFLLGTAGLGITFDNTLVAFNCATSFNIPNARSYYVGSGTNTTAATGSTWGTAGLSFGPSTAALTIGTNNVALSATGLSFASATAAVTAGTIGLSGRATVAALTVSGASTLNTISANASTFSGNLILSGANTLTTGTGAVIFGGSLNVSGSTVLTAMTASAATALNTLTANASTFNGNVAVSGTNTLTAGALTLTGSILSTKPFTTSTLIGFATNTPAGTYCICVGTYGDFTSGQLSVSCYGPDNVDSVIIDLYFNLTGVVTFKVTKPQSYVIGLIIKKVSVTSSRVYVYYLADSNSVPGGISTTVSWTNQNGGTGQFTPQVTNVTSSTADAGGQSPDNGNSLVVVPGVAFSANITSGGTLSSTGITQLAGNSLIVLPNVGLASLWTANARSQFVVNVGSYTTEFLGTVNVALSGNGHSDVITIDIMNHASTTPTVTVRHATTHNAGSAFFTDLVVNYSTKTLFAYITDPGTTNNGVILSTAVVQNGLTFLPTAFTQTTPVLSTVAVATTNSFTNFVLITAGGCTYGNLSANLFAFNGQGFGTPTTLAGRASGTKIVLYSQTANTVSLNDYCIGVGVNSDLTLNAAGRISNYVSGIESLYTHSAGIVLPRPNNFVSFSTSVGAPGTTAGTKLLLYPGNNSIGTTTTSNGDYSIGINNFTLWYNTSGVHAFCVNATECMRVDASSMNLSNTINLPNNGSVFIGGTYGAVGTSYTRIHFSNGSTYYDNTGTVFWRNVNATELLRLETNGNLNVLGSLNIPSGSSIYLGGAFGTPGASHRRDFFFQGNSYSDTSGIFFYRNLAGAQLMSLDQGGNGVFSGNMKCNTVLTGGIQFPNNAGIECTTGAIASNTIKAFKPSPTFTLKMDQNGYIGTDASSRRYKIDIQDIEDVESENIFDNLRPIKYKSNPLTTGDQSGSEQFGFIAEEVDLIDSRLVGYDTEGRPEALSYDRFVVILIKESQKLKKRVQELEAKFEMLYNRG